MRILIISFFIVIKLHLICQTNHVMNLWQPINLTNGPYILGTYFDDVNFYGKIKNNAEVDIKPEHEILFGPDAEITNFNNSGYLYARIEPKQINVAAFNPNGWDVFKYDKFELGLTLPTNVTNQIQDFLNGNNGLNPYDPNQIKIQCDFTNSGNTYTRYGFYYRDFTTQNNEWIEQPTDYVYRVRFAPPTVGSWNVNIKIYVNNTLLETVYRYFSVFNKQNPGHLKMASGNLRKLQFTSGAPFFALGQNIGYAVPNNQPNCASYDCVTPYSFNKQREYVADLANNGGNFVRLRLDALNGLAEWPYKKQTTNDPTAPNRPLSSYLTNYNDNQRYLWEMDKTFSLMEGTDIYCMLNLFPDQNFSVDGAYDCGHTITWNNNPYNTITGNDLAGCKSFFTNNQSKDTYRKWLYYIIARYGYSTRLGIWEMINETSGVANTYSWFINCTPGNFAMYSPYNNESSFANDVNNWTCDMKYYLEQFYPWHPTTTGNTGEEGLPHPSCLNIWSSNQYDGFIQADASKSGYGEYRDANYNPQRWDRAKYFHSQSKPFIFGELGLGDGMNFVDKYNDREFHNTLWATSMMGGIGSGLYWNDWEQSGGVNHRANFRAIHDFFTYNTNLNQTLSPQKAKDNGVGSLNVREIHTFSMKSPNQEYVVGWAQNNSSNWTIDYQSIPTTYDVWGNLASSPSLALSESKFNGSIQQYSCFSTNQNPYIKVDGLKISRRYKVKIYDTYNNANILDNFHVTTNLAGALLFRRFMPTTISSPFYPDYAFIAEYDPVFSFRQSNSNQGNDTLDVSDSDTLCLSPDFINDNISNYTYYWNLGNGTTSNDSMPCTHYTEEGTYTIEATATNVENDSVIKFSKEFVVIKKFLYRNDNVIASPNPASNKIYLSFDKTQLINPKIRLIDILGRVNEVYLNEDNSIITEYFETGIYFIKFTTNDYEQIIKINIQH